MKPMSSPRVNMANNTENGDEVLDLYSGDPLFEPLRLSCLKLLLFPSVYSDSFHFLTLSPYMIIYPSHLT